MAQQHSFTWDAFLKADALPRWGRGCTATADIVATSVAKAKRRTNTVLTPEQWTQQGYARLPPSALEPPKGGEVLEQVDARYISSAEFSTRFMERKVPCVVTGATEAWRGRADWRCFETLAQRIGTKKFKVGNTEGGYGDERVSMRLRHFLAYCDAQSSADGDDSPLYIFEDEFGETAPALLEDYTAPHMFKEDLFAPPLLSEKRRPPHRWFLIGPARSGSGVHLDPLGTSAWNGLVSGRKRWVLFSPNVPKVVAKGTKLFKLRKDNDEPIAWFQHALPLIRESVEHGFGDRAARRRDGMRMIEFIQEAGEVVYIPGGWWHAVLNLTATVAVTHNFVSVANFPTVWRRVRKERKKMAARWLAELMVHRPELSSLAIRINAADGVRVVPKPSGGGRGGGGGGCVVETAGEKQKRKSEKKARKAAKKKQKKAKEDQTRAAKATAAGAGAGAGAGAAPPLPRPRSAPAASAPARAATAAPASASASRAPQRPHSSSRWGTVPRSTAPSTHVRFT